LFYVGEGTNSQDNKNIDEVSSILIKNQWRASQFIGETDKKLRKTLLDAFKNKEIDALVAMKVLDEGIDVPACQRAYILASTKNPRQYIQRRGRVLRRFPNKSSASIYDFVVLPCKNYATKYKKNLLKSELERIRDFTLLATNKVEIETIIDTLEMENA
jgi:superfamily II DNA or RNA helicase